MTQKRTQHIHTKLDKQGNTQSDSQARRDRHITKMKKNTQTRTQTNAHTTTEGETYIHVHTLGHKGSINKGTKHREGK